MSYLQKLPKYLYLPNVPLGLVFEYTLNISPQSNQISYTHGSQVIINSGQIGTFEKLAKQIYDAMRDLGLLKYGSNEFNEHAVHYDEHAAISSAVMEDVNGVLQTLVKKSATEEEKQYREKFYQDFWNEWDSN